MIFRMRITRFAAVLAVAALPLTYSASALGGDRDPVVAFDGRRRARQGQRAREQVQREPEGLQGRAGLQGQLSRIDDRGDRRVPRRQRAAHPAGVRGRHRDDDGGQGRDRARVQADEGRRRAVRSQGLPAGGRRLLHRHQGQHAVVPVQQLDGRLLLQQGRLQEGGPRSGEGAEDLEGIRRRRGEAQGSGPGVRRTPPGGRRGCTSRTSAPGTTCRSAPRRTAWRAPTPSSRSTRRCTCAT